MGLRSVASGRLGQQGMLLSGYAGRAGTQFLILFVFAKRSGPEGAGSFAFATAVAGMAFVVTELALRNVYATLKDPPTFRSVFAIRSILSGLTLAGLAIVPIFVHPKESQVFIAVALVRAADSVLDISIARYLFLDRVHRAAQTLWLNVLITVAATLAVIASGGTGVAACLLSAAASALVVAVVTPQLLGEEADARWVPTAEELRRLVRAGAQLGMAQTLSSLGSYLPVLILKAFGTASSVGIFAVCQYPYTFANLTFNAGMQTWLRSMRSAYVDRGADGLQVLRSRFLRTTLWLSGVGALLTILVFPPAMNLLLGRRFVVGYTEIVPIALAIVLLGLEYWQTAGLLVLNRYGSRAVAAGLGNVLSLSLGLALASQAGVALGAWLVVAATAGRVGYNAFISRTPFDSSEKSTSARKP